MEGCHVLHLQGKADPCELRASYWDVPSWPHVGPLSWLLGGSCVRDIDGTIRQLKGGGRFFMTSRDSWLRMNRHHIAQACIRYGLML
jgi:hypothetical protein